MAYRSYDIEKLELFKRFGFELPHYNHETLKTFYEACLLGNMHITKSMIENRFQNGLDVNIRYNDDIGTPMHAAVYNGHEDIVELLLKNADELDYDETCCNNQHKTPYMFAREKGHRKIVQLFEDHGRAFDFDI